MILILLTARGKPEAAICQGRSGPSALFNSVASRFGLVRRPTSGFSPCMYGPQIPARKDIAQPRGKSRIPTVGLGYVASLGGDPRSRDPSRGDLPTEK